LVRRYTDDVPVVFIGAREAARHRVDVGEFREKLRAAGEVARGRTGGV